MREFFLHPDKHPRRMDFKLMRYFILIFKSYELTCCQICSRGLALETAEELCCHFSSQKKPCFIAGALRALWTGKYDRYPTLPRTVEMSVTCTSDVLGTKPAATDMLVLMASCVWCVPGQSWGAFLWYASMLCQSGDWTCWWKLRENQKGLPPFQSTLSFTQAAVSVSFATMCSLHPVSGATVPSFVDLAGCNEYERELRIVVMCFKTLVH